MARIDDFKARFPNHETAFGEGVVDSLFPVVEAVSDSYYGGDYDANAKDKEIFMQLWAHLIVIESSDSAKSVRNEASKGVGSVNVSYEASQQETGRMGFFNTTKYGQQFLYLTSNNHGAIFV